MKFSELIIKRESTRRFKPVQVERDLLEKCLEAARVAPSASNSQPWYFRIIDNREVIRELALRAFSGLYKLNRFTENASAMILVSTRKSKIITRTAQQIQGIRYNLVDIGIACDHLVLRAEELGLKSCWIGWFNEKAVKKFLKIPRSEKIDMIIALGYPADEKSARKKVRKSLEEIREYIE